MAIRYKRINKENNFPVIFYILYAGGLSFGIDAKREAYTALRSSKIKIENWGKRGVEFRDIEYEFGEAIFNCTWDSKSE